MGRLRMAIDSLYLTVYSLGDSMKSSMQLVMHADAPSSSMRVWESESNCLWRACGVVQPLGHVEVMQVAVVKGSRLGFFCQ